MNYKKVNTLKLSDPAYPKVLGQISDAPKQLFYAGAAPVSWLDRPRVAIVGSRKMTSYGEYVTKQLAHDLASTGIVIISGLAMGVDAAAHRATINAGGLAVAVLPTSLDNIYPAAHRGLAEQIIDRGGTLLCEYRSGDDIYTTNFVARNRIVSGLADIVLITEAALKSGSLHTARFAIDQGKTVMVVPGNITNPSSEGCNNLIKSGAVPVTHSDDVMFALGIRKPKTKKPRVFRGGKLEQQLLELIASGVNSQEDLALSSRRDGAEVISALTMLEISGYIRPEGVGNWSIL